MGTATQKTLELSPTMLEIIERQIIDLARKQKAELKPYLPEGTEAILFVEFQDENGERLRKNSAKLRGKRVQQEKLANRVKVARNDRRDGHV